MYCPISQIFAALLAATPAQGQDMGMSMSVAATPVEAPAIERAAGPAVPHLPVEEILARANSDQPQVRLAEAAPVEPTLPN